MILPFVFNAILIFEEKCCLLAPNGLIMPGIDAWWENMKYLAYAHLPAKAICLLQHATSDTIGLLGRTLQKLHIASYDKQQSKASSEDKSPLAKLQRCQ